MPISPTLANAPIIEMRARYAGLLADHERQIAALRAKVQVLDEVLESQRELAIGQEVIAEIVASDELPESLTEAALWVINKFGRGSPLGTGEIRAHLAAQGYNGSGKNYTGILAITLKRLRDSGRIQGVKTSIGNWLYRPAN